MTSKKDNVNRSISQRSTMIHTIRFYQQQRLDGGVRTGMGLDDVQALHHFEKGSQEHDPALLWFVDLVFEGAKLPTEPEVARRWLQEQSGPIMRGLHNMAEELKLGMDDEDVLQRRLTGLSGGVSGRVSVSALRRLPPGDLARKLNRLAKNWSKTLGALDSLVGTNARS